MRFRADRDAFADAITWTARALPVRPAVPVLAGMRLDITDAAAGTLGLSAFDYEVSTRASVDVQVEEPGSVLVSGRLLSEIVRNLPPYPVEMRTDGSRALLTCGSARFTLLTLPIEDYPTLPSMPDVTGSLPGDVFASAVRQVAPSASRDDTLPMLTGVNLTFSGGTVFLAATDRYRIAVREAWWQPRSPDVDTSALVPARTLFDTARSLTSGGNVDIALSAVDGSGARATRGEGMIGFEYAGRRTTTRLIDSDFITYDSRFPTEFAATAEVPVAPLVEAVKRVALVADRSTPLRLSFGQGEVVLEAGSGDDAQAAEALDVKFEGEPMRIAFSPQYFLDGLGGVESETAFLNFTAPTKPAVITGAPAEEGGRPNYRYLVMPLRVA
ncbi:DNA polymerase III subunit beta [Actinorugispora endophytica]|uniref:Beta sliding clamp n=1 Tax=Actinorugispora endophytica TaxID=1605990 RepID=A0A4V3D9B4_9ACTN|nr:DNA polymerase III subunit beta [Actinorugispora endophytica]TDQ55480.1 DNA polymerase-3 subunit beta [Actinorugispora endophytica]